LGGSADCDEGTGAEGAGQGVRGSGHTNKYRE
jgi:hypothetical protein